MKKFNTTGICKPEKHYMVDLHERLIQIKEMVFSVAFLEAFLKKIPFDEMESSLKEKLEQLRKFYTEQPEKLDLVVLFNLLSEVCEVSEKPVVLVIDEVDSASNNQVFLDFLAQLRGGFLARDEESTFHSVILAGLYDIKNLKQKIRSEEEHKTNSPWNIAADFDINMSLSEIGIANMLKEYDKDYKIGMDVSSMAKEIHDYTSGYPFLVSRICKLLDEKVSLQMSRTDAWTHRGFVEALKLLYNEKNTLFDSLTHRMEENKELETLVYDVLFTGKHILYDPYNVAIEHAQMLGFVKNKNGAVAIANRIFETRLYNMFLSTSEARSTNTYVVGMKDNIEAQTRDARRTDVIVDYNGQQYIIELKIWHGEAYNQSAEEQLSDYLDTYHEKKGYLLTFNFNKKKEVGVKTITYKDKIIVEAIV